jgi:LPXTG-motif cell wall-anchored protein
VGGLFATGGSAAVAQTVSSQPFSGYATGTQVSTNALQIGDTQVANVQQAFAGASVDSGGLANAIINEMGQTVQASAADKNSGARGSGAEVGLVTNFPDADNLNQLILSGLATATAPPNEGPVNKSVSIDLPPVLYAGLLTGTAQALYDPNTCIIGQPFSYGKGEAANVQVLPTGPNGPGGLINTGQTPSDNTAKTRSFEYLVPNGDGTFGLVSETRQTLVPVSIGTPVAGLYPLSIVVDGDFVMRVTATGKPGRPAIGPLGSGASIEFSDPLITISSLGIPALSIHLSQLLPAGLNVPLAPIADLSVGGPPRSIGSFLTPAPAQIAGDGTSVAAAYDLLQLGILQGIPGLTGVDLRVGHMEGTVSVPEGGIKCNIPIKKSASPDPAVAGQDVTVTISIPDDPARFAELFACDLINISATDEHHVLEGNPRFELTGASNGGVIDGNTVHWDNLGNYTRGSPPILLTVTVHIIGGTGTIEDVADVHATLGNCNGGIAGQDIAGSGLFNGGAVLGSVRFQGPRVGAGTLAATGQDTQYLLFGGAMLVGAVGVMGVRRRLRRQASSPPSGS